MEGMQNEKNLFSKGSIKTILEKPDAKQLNPAVFRHKQGQELLMFAGSISTKWHADKKVLLGLEREPKNPVGCPSETIRKKTFVNGEMLNVSLPTFKATVGPDNKLTVNDNKQLEFLKKLIKGEATTNDISPKSLKPWGSS